ncbi:MAG: threonine--tRNA ligase [Thermoplasmata archaeon HGW-Thermoplasmata-1]|nr:MAG: threonine--tRNA ligase [Thermoplasmata archaeon HGW-Thermoplasmata-1]
MKLLLIHSDYIEYETKKKAIAAAEDIGGERKHDRMEEALAAFIAVEKDDERDVAATVANAATQIRDVAKQVDTKRIMLYPYAHLSSELASPKAAMRALESLEEALKDDCEVKRSPFGWYKSFRISCKGHPLSELSRHVLPEKAQGAGGGGAKGEEGEEENVSEAVKKEKELRSFWYILTPSGDLVEAENFDFGGHDELKRFYEYEAKGSRVSAKEPAHIRLMQDLELVDYEPGSDSGNMRWYPKGQMIKRLLEERVGDMCNRAGAMRVETPIMYSIDHPQLKKYLNKFPARQYRVFSEDSEFFLRFAACFGQYLMAHDATISYKHLPLRLFELTHYSFRREQRGELAGIKRLRCFTMPDMHTMCADIGQAKEEFKRQYLYSMEWMADLGIPYQAAIRFVRPFYEENKEFATELAQLTGRPVLIEMWDQRFFYFVMKFEFNVNDTTDKSFALSTVQIDVENTKSFDITYADESGEKQNPLLLHASLSGAIDRCVCSLLENEAMKMERGEKGSLPFWLSPTHVRLLAVGDEYVDECRRIAEKLELAVAKRCGAKLRVDIDDRDDKIGKKIRNAEKEWVPAIIVVGDREVESKSYAPRLRIPQMAKGREQFTADELAEILGSHLEGKPSAPLPLPKMLSMRPRFRG